MIFCNLTAKRHLQINGVRMLNEVKLLITELISLSLLRMTTHARGVKGVGVEIDLIIMNNHIM